MVNNVQLQARLTRPCVLASQHPRFQPRNDSLVHVYGMLSRTRPTRDEAIWIDAQNATEEFGGQDLMLKDSKKDTWGGEVRLGNTILTRLRVQKHGQVTLIVVVWQKSVQKLRTNLRAESTRFAACFPLPHWTGSEWRRRGTPPVKVASPRSFAF